MSQLSRGIVWRAGQTATLTVLGAVVVAGCLVAAVFSELSDTPPGAIGVLVLLGVVVLSVQAASVARSRRSEVALAQLRGLHGLRLFSYFLAEPLTLLVVATALGILLGRTVATLAADRWLSSSASLSIGTAGWITVGVAALAALGSVIAGSWATVREPLVSQLNTSQRPRPAATLVLFGQTVTMVAAFIGGYQAANANGARAGWAAIVSPALLSPILIGLAAGQLTVWMLRAAAGIVIRRTRERGSMASYLAARRISRRADTVFGARLVIAAAVVAAVTANAASAVTDWQDETTRLAMGGPTRYTVETGGMAAFSLARDVDPDGRWLMPMVGVFDNSPPYRRVFVDTERWDAVVADFFDGTRTASVGDHLDALQAATPVDPIVGNQASATFTNESLQQNFGVKVTISYLSESGTAGFVVLKAPRPTQAEGSTQVEKRFRDCDVGCVVTQLLIDGYQPVQSLGDLAITSVDFGGTQLLERDTWSVPFGTGSPGQVHQEGSTLFASTDRFGSGISVEPESAHETLPALLTPGLKPNRLAGADIGYTVDGDGREIETVGRSPALPFVGTQGMLMDLSRALASGGRVIPAASAYVIARSDTPPEITAALEDSTLVSDYTTLDAEVAKVRQGDDAQGIRLYILMSVFAGLIAVIGLMSSVIGQRLEREREAAGLRIAGLKSRTIAAAHRVEAIWLAAGVFIAVAAAGWVGARVTIGALELVPQTDTQPPVQVEPNFALIVMTAAAASIVVWIMTIVLNRVVARRSSPRMLRESANG